MQDISRYFSSRVPDEKALKDIVHFQKGVAHVKPVARLRHGDLRPYYLPDPPDPSDPTNASKFIEAATINQSVTQDVQRDVDLQLREIPQIGQFNPLTDLIQLYTQFVDFDDTVLLDVPIGIFGMTIPDRQLWDSGNIWQVKGYDLTERIARIQFYDAYVIPPGTRVTDAIKALLMADSLPPSRGGRQATTQFTSTGGPTSQQSLPGIPVASVPGITTYIAYAAGNQLYYRWPSSGPSQPCDVFYHPSIRVQLADPPAPIDPVTGQACTLDSSCNWHLPSGTIFDQTQPVSYTSGGGVSQLGDVFSSSTRIGSYPGAALGGSSTLVGGPVPFDGISGGFVRYYTDANTSPGYVRAIYSGDVPLPQGTGWTVDTTGQVSTQVSTYCAASYPTGGCPWSPGGAAWNVNGVYPPGFGPGETPTRGSYILINGGASSALPTNAQGWPDPARPGLTPTGCEFIGANIPASRIAITDSPIIAELPIILARGTNVLASINSLLKSLNYETLWCDEVGIFRARPVPYYNDFIPPSSWEYNTYTPTQAAALGTWPSILKPGVTVRIADQTSLANVVVVESSKNNAETFISAQWNMNTNSAISIPNLGYAVLKYIRDDTIISQSVCDLRALVELQFAALATQAVDFTTHLNPFHQSGDYIDINVTDKNGVLEVDSSTSPFYESAWTMDLTTREMRHTCGRVVPI